MTFPIVYDVAYIDKAMTKLGYNKIIQEEAVFYQSPQGFMPTIMTSDEKVVDKFSGGVDLRLVEDADWNIQ